MTEVPNLLAKIKAGTQSMRNRRERLQEAIELLASQAVRCW